MAAWQNRKTKRHGEASMVSRDVSGRNGCGATGQDARFIPIVMALRVYRNSRLGLGGVGRMARPLSRFDLDSGVCLLRLRKRTYVEAYGLIMIVEKAPKGAF